MTRAPRNISAVRRISQVRKIFLTYHGATAHYAPPKVLHLVMEDMPHPYMHSPPPTPSRLRPRREPRTASSTSLLESLK